MGPHTCATGVCVGVCAMSSAHLAFTDKDEWGLIHVLQVRA